MKSRLALTLALSAAMWTTTGAQVQKERCGMRAAWTAFRAVE